MAGEDETILTETLTIGTEETSTIDHSKIEICNAENSKEILFNKIINLSIGLSRIPTRPAGPEEFKVVGVGRALYFPKSMIK